jgi:tRNA (cytidine/uridine-2'-O-)-methyltransferase
MFDIVLYQPEIPPNTGNILRLAANTGCRLHLVKPLGFRLSDRALKRSGLDYGDIQDVTVHGDWAACRRYFHHRRLFAVSTRAERSYADCGFTEDDAFVFGPETRGLPEELLASFPEQQRIRLPMTEGSRSLNLSNAVAVVVYEAWRQTGFTGGNQNG